MTPPRKASEDKPATPPWSQERFNTALDILRAYPVPASPGEPAFHFLANSNFNEWAIQYSNEPENRNDVLYVEIPDESQKIKDPLKELICLMLEGFNDPHARKGEDLAHKVDRLKQHFSDHPLQLLIIADVHKLPPQFPNSSVNAFKSLISLTKADLRPLSVLFIGDYKVLDELVNQDEWTARRVSPLPYPYTKEEEAVRFKAVFRAMKSQG